MADEQITSNTANIPYVNFTNVGSDQAAPAAGRAILYIKSGVAYVRLDAGDPVAVGGSVALAEGRLAVGNGSGVLSALALGTEGQVVTADASGHAVWDSPAPAGGGDTLISAHTVAAGGETSHTFSTIPDTYQVLRLDLVGRSDSNQTYWDDVCLRFNGDSGNNYWGTDEQLAGNSAYGYVHNTSSSGPILPIADASYAVAYPTVGRIIIPFYKDTTWQKVAYANGGHHYGTVDGQHGPSSGVCHWANTAAITSVTLLLRSGGKFVENTSLRLYGQG